jgi:hypothetical protein
METIDVINDIIKNNSEIYKLNFSQYPSQVLVQNNDKLSHNDKELINNALKIRKEYHLPFWDSLMLSLFDKDEISLNLISSVLIHNANKEKITTRDTKKIKKILDDNPDINLSLNSKVHFKNKKIKHLFLLDFHIYPSTNNLEIVCKVLRLLNVRGYILDSGESYHFISKDFYELDTLINLLAKSLLFSPIVDKTWIAHQVIERSCSLRVGRKNNKVPVFIKQI